MNILFSGARLGKLCNDSKLARRKLGDQQAARLRQRLDELAAAPNLAVMGKLPGRFHALTGDRKGQFSLDLVHPQRLVFEAADEPVPRLPAGGIDQASVKTIRILEITDTHD